MKTKFLLLAVVLLKLTVGTLAFAQDDEMIFPPETDSESISSQNGSTPPVIIDESDSQDVSDVEEYDG